MRWNLPSPPPRNGASSAGTTGPARVPPEDLNDPAFWRARLGEKVSIRFRIQDEAPYPESEAVGVVAKVEGDDAVMTVVTRRGEVRSAHVSELVSAKLF